MRALAVVLIGCLALGPALAHAEGRRTAADARHDLDQFVRQIGQRASLERLLEPGHQSLDMLLTGRQFQKPGADEQILAATCLGEATHQLRSG